MGSKRFIPISLLVIIILSTVILNLHADSQSNSDIDSASAPTQTTADISFNVNATGIPINKNLLGTNLPAWINPNRTEDSTLINRTIANTTPLLRIPGGSWSNGYNWLACEMGDTNNCWHARWALHPTDFINFLQATGTEAMYTINMNGTAKEAAALVAFFNGSVNDNTVIGTDHRGQNWYTVSHWANLRRDHGNPDPFYIKYFEIGNEIYGGKPGKGTDCPQWGWEEHVWTCDGREYINGIGSGSNRNEGFIEFRDEMRKVDPSILVGAVGVSNQSGWSNWGNEVIEEAGDVMDFYVVHQYAFDRTPASYQDVLARPQATWGAIKADIDAAFDQHANGRSVPIAVTEYNLFSTERSESERAWMSQAVNGLFIADTIGQMMQHEFDMANQWDIAHGEGNDDPGYGLMQADTKFRSPQYYAFPMWSRFGSQMLPVNSSHDAATELSVYAGRIDPWTVSVMAINKTGNTINSSIDLQDAPALLFGGTADVVKASSLSSMSVTFNGSNNPNDSLSNAPATNLGVVANPLTYAFAPYSITLLRLKVGEFVPTDWVYLPAVTK